MLSLDLTCNLAPKQRWAEIRFDPRSTVAAAGQKICNHVGCSPETTKYLVFNRKDEEICSLDDRSKSLEDYKLESGWRIHVIDSNPNSLVGELEAMEARGVGKFELSEEAYAKRKDTAREFLKNLRSTRPELFKKKEEKETVSESELRQNIGKRCQIKSTTLRGQIVWAGIPSAETAKVNGRQQELLYGIVLDTPVGLFDGVEPDSGKVLFDCGGLKKGMLLAPKNLEVGSEYEPLEADELDEIL